jgi:uncharacterized protein (TIRG00374 family)
LKARRILFWVLVLAAVGLVIARFGEVRSLAQTLLQGRWEWVLAAVVVTGLYSLSRAFLYQAAFAVVGVSSKLRQLVPVYFAAQFANLVMPVAGAGGAAVFVDDAVGRGQSGPSATLGTILVMAAEFAAFLVLLAGGLLYLRESGELQVFQSVAAIIFLVIVAWFVAVLLLGAWSPNTLRWLIGRLQKLSGWLASRTRRITPLDEGWSERTADSLIKTAQAITARPVGVGLILLLGLFAHLVNLAIFYLLFQAFEQPAPPGTLLAGYSMGMLFWYVAVVPQGIGAVEGVIALVLASLGIPLEKATLLGLSFRGLIFWLPLAVGFFMLRRVRSFSSGAAGRPATVAAERESRPR